MKKMLTPLLLIISFCSPLRAEVQLNYQLTADLKYSEASVINEGEVNLNDLLMDMYEPTEPVTGNRPAVILAFGGAFHRGHRRAAPFKENGAENTPVADYCKLLAHHGYVCFAIDYRLMPDNPIVDDTLKQNPSLMSATESVSAKYTGRIDYVRTHMNLAPLNDQSRPLLWNAILAATEDMSQAFTHIHDNAKQYKLDPEKIAIGGFSAGAITAYNVAYGLHKPAAAVIALSGSMWGFDLSRTIPSSNTPPVLMTMGQNDLAGVQLSSQGLIQLFNALGTPYSFNWVPGYGHFYSSEVITVGADGSRATLQQRIIQFLDTTLAKDSVKSL